ncbi:MAG: acyl-CoA dehydrogenase family protein [Rhodospirillales bacterium]|nr:acyl-CoA dehydrogenase family protein [Rhodospirillales bacterium]
MFELTDTQRQIQDTAAKLAKAVIQPRAAEIDKTEEYPWDNVQALTDAGFMGMTIPEAYGGQGASYLDAVLVVEEMAKVCGVTSRIVVEGNMGAIGAIMAYGTEDQKILAAGLVLAGDKPAICITEPGAGSAASEMTTRADKTKNGYVLNGAKHWITGGGVSKLHLIFARVFEGGEPQGIAGFICVRDPDQGTPEGLVIGAREPTMGLRGIPETEIFFKDLHIPADMVLVPPAGLRRGFAGLMTAYNAQRVGAATVALGIAQGAFEQAMDYAQTREQFGRPIAEFQGLQWMLVDMSIALEAARLMIYKAASGTGDGTGFPDMTAAAQAKIMASEAAIKVTIDALQVFGAAGYSRNLPMERMARDARMFTIGGGTAQILRTVVASQILNRKLPQTRDGYVKLAEKAKK